jgi:hypothetical protein
LVKFKCTGKSATSVLETDGFQVKTFLEAIVYVLKLVHGLIQPLVLLERPCCFHTSISGKNNAATAHTVEAKLRWIRSVESFCLFFRIRSEECLDVTLILEPVATETMTLIDSIQETLLKTVKIGIAPNFLIAQEAVQLIEIPVLMVKGVQAFPWTGLVQLNFEAEVHV